MDVEILASLIPEEVWMQVLERLDPVDKQTACNSSSYFRNLLSSSRQIFLFSSVWNILTLHLYSDLEQEETQPTYPESYKEFESTPWKLRLVCKSWCQAVDNLYETFNYKFVTTKEAREPPEYDRQDRLEDLNYSPRPYNLFTCSELAFTDADETRGSILDVFIRHLGSSNPDKNPFIGRRVFLQPICTRYIGDHEPCRVLRTVTNFLQLYGCHIWYCTLKPHVSDCSNECYFKTVTNWLELMPNLKTLHLESEFPRNISKYDLKNCSFPKLPNLVALYLGDLPRIYIDRLLEENSQVTICNVDSYEIKYSLMDLQATLGNLNCLSLSLNNESFQQLEKLKDKWNLERISLCFQHCDEYIEWQRVFNLISRWKDTVKNVTLRMPVPRNKKHCLKLLRMNNLQLNLPNVKRIRLILPMLYFTKHFISLKSSLELLEVVKSHFETDKLKLLCANKVVNAKHLRKEGLFDLYEENDIHHSNMWRLFPKLRRFDYMDSSQDFFKKYMMEEPYKNYFGRNIRSALDMPTGGRIGCLVFL